MSVSFDEALLELKHDFWNNGPVRPTKNRFLTKGAMMNFDGEKIPYVAYGGNRQVMTESQYRKALKNYREEEVRFKHNYLLQHYPDTDFADRYIEEIVKKDRNTSNMNLTEVLKPLCQERSDACA